MKPEVRASGLRGIGNYVKTLDPAFIETIEAGYSRELRSALFDAAPDEWYPVDLWMQALDGIVAAHGDITSARAAVRAAGRHICEGTVNSFHRFLMRIMTPSLFAKKSGVMIAKDFQGFPGGELDYHYDLSKEAEGELVLEVRNAQHHPYLGGTGQGFIEFAFHHMGKKNVVVEEPTCALTEWAPAHVLWRIRWS
jgi:hypothetical protein